MARKTKATVAKSSIPRTIPNPDWLASEEYQRNIEQVKDVIAGHGEILEDYFPEDYGKDLPEDGGWIIVLNKVCTGRQVATGEVRTIDVPHLSVWFAMPHVTGLIREVRLKWRKKDAFKVAMKQAIIYTKEGAVHLWPHEYNRFDIDKFLDFTDEDGFYIHYLSENAAVDPEKLFYLRTRGIGKAQAQRMLLGELKDPNYCYFTFHPSIAGFFGDGFGSGRIHPVNRLHRTRSHNRRGATV